MKLPKIVIDTNVLVATAEKSLEYLRKRADCTETGVANELVEMGVPKHDIILAFHAPYKRQYTGFGVG